MIMEHGSLMVSMMTGKAKQRRRLGESKLEESKEGQGRPRIMELTAIFVLLPPVATYCFVFFHLFFSRATRSRTCQYLTNKNERL